MAEKKQYLTEAEKKVYQSLPGLWQIIIYKEEQVWTEATSKQLDELVSISEEAIQQFKISKRNEFVHPNDSGRYHSAIIRAMHLENEETSTEDIRLRSGDRADYKWYRVEISARRVEEEDDTYIIMLHYTLINDLQNRNDLQEEETKKSDLLLDAVLNTTVMPIFWKDDQRRFLGANRAFLDYYGFPSVDSILGKTDEEMGWHPEPGPFMNDEERVLEGMSTYLVQGKCKCKGEVRDILASKNPIYRNGRIVGLVGSFTDVTESFRQSRQINSLYDQLMVAKQSRSRSDLAVNEYLSRISYEIRTPLSSIIGFSDMGLQQTEDEADKEFFQRISDSGNRLMGVMKDLFDLQKIENGNMTLAKRRTGIRSLMDRIMEEMAPLAEKQGVKLICDEEILENNYVITDGSRVRRILENLVSNAIRLTEEGGHVFLSAEESIHSNVVQVGFIIRAGRCDVSPEYLLKIFEPYSQENKTFDQYEKGSGLSMAISRSFARLMGGNIIAETEGGDCIFRATMLCGMCSQEEAGKAKREETAIKADDAILSGKRILVAEDNALNIEVALAILNKIDIEVETATNGSEAVEKFSKSQNGDFDAILMDLQMPVMDGYEATKSIRRLPREDAGSIPIIAMSADVLEDSINKAIEKGMDGYISKPLSAKSLFSTLKRVIN